MCSLSDPGLSANVIWPLSNREAGRPIVLEHHFGTELRELKKTMRTIAVISQTHDLHIHLKTSIRFLRWPDNPFAVVSIHELAGQENGDPLVFTRGWFEKNEPEVILFDADSLTNRSTQPYFMIFKEYGLQCRAVVLSRSPELYPEYDRRGQVCTDFSSILMAHFVTRFERKPELW